MDQKARAMTDLQVAQPVFTLVLHPAFFLRTTRLLAIVRRVEVEASTLALLFNTYAQLNADEMKRGGQSGRYPNVSRVA